MKTAFLFLLLTATAWANEEFENFKAQGTISYSIKMIEYSNTYHARTDSEISVASWGEGKLRVNIAFAPKTCAKLALLSLVGIDQGLGEFKLYQNINDLTLDKDAIGSLIIMNKEATLILDQTYYVFTSGCWIRGYPNNSGMYLQPNTQNIFKIKKKFKKSNENDL